MYLRPRANMLVAELVIPETTTLVSVLSQFAYKLYLPVSNVVFEKFVTQTALNPHG